jgi:hypothetical protein
LTNSNAATALLAGPSHNSDVSGVTRNTQTLLSLGPTEIEAIEKARRLLNNRHIEVRRGARVVARLRPMDK